MAQVRHSAYKRLLFLLLLAVVLVGAKELVEHATEQDLPPQPPAAEAVAHSGPATGSGPTTNPGQTTGPGPGTPPLDVQSLTDTLGDGESLFLVFQKHGIDPIELVPIEQAARGVYDLKRLRPGTPYTISTAGGSVRSLVCQVSRDETLAIERGDDGTFTCELVPVEYERKVAHIGGVIRGSLVESMNDVVVALELSEIFAWDIDFTTDIRAGDTYKAVVEELWLNGKFVKHGRVLAAEFSNNGATHKAYRFEEDGRPGYYDTNGKSVRRAFLKAPLNFRRISSGYGRRRHPITKKVHVHQGIDYSAPKGTPVSAVGDGTVEYAGYKGANGKLVIIRHPNGYKTYYLHLHRIAKGVRRGRKVVQGQLIGTVGSTGRSTGPHLDYRIKKGSRFVNPLKLAIPKAGGVSKAVRNEYDTLRTGMEARLAAIPVEDIIRMTKTRPEG